MKHEHWARKSLIVAVIAGVITYLGGLNLSLYVSGHVSMLSSTLTTAPFWIAVASLFVIAVLVDLAKSSLKQVYWMEDLFGGILGAFGYYVLFALLGVYTFSTFFGFVVGTVVLFFLFYIGFTIGHSVDESLVKPELGIN